MVEPITSIALTAVVVKAAAEKLTNLFIETTWEGGGGLLGWMGKTADAGTRQVIFDASKRYIENYRERHCLLKVLGMRKPVELESVYTAVRFLKDDEIQQFASVESLEEAYRERQNRRFRAQDGIKRNGIDVANAEQFLMVLAGPGAGKSTFLRKMGLEALKGKRKEFSHACVPVFLELKQFNLNKTYLEKIIAAEFETCGFPQAKSFTEKALRQGKLLVLLDGLDEVPAKHQNQVIHAIQNFVDQYDKNRYIASCRTAAYRGGFRRFTDVVMAEFEDDQIRQFITNWFQSDEDKRVRTAEKCWEILQKSENSGAKELAHTPLLLTFLCLVYDRSQTFPSNRSVLYRKALRILLEEWAAEKRINQDAIYDGLSVELEELLLSEIAAKGFEEDRLFFSQRELVEDIKTFLASNLNAPTHLNGEAILKEIAIQQGILVERAEDIYSFSHLTLQEYLTAQYIDDHRRTQALVRKHLTEQRWREVFLLVSGLMRGGADDLLLQMETQAKTFINTPKLQSLLAWADTATAGSKGVYKPVAKRAVALYFALDFDLALDPAFAFAFSYAHPHSLKHALDPARDLDLDFAIDLARGRALTLTHALDPTLDLTLDFTFALDPTRAHNFEKIEIFETADFTGLIAQLEALRSQVPDVGQPVEMRRAFAAKIQQLWFEKLGLDPKLARLSGEESNSLSNYLYANELMVRCKEAAVRVSPEVWAGIEARMLTVWESRG